MNTAAEESGFAGLPLSPLTSAVVALNPERVTLSHDVTTCANVIFVQKTPHTVFRNGVIGSISAQ